MWEGDKRHGSKGRCSDDLERSGGAGEEGSRAVRAGKGSRGGRGSSGITQEIDPQNKDPAFAIHLQLQKALGHCLG